VLLGASAAVLVMSSVVILQCFMFADGGLTALGANLFDMALVAPVVGYGVYRLVRRAAPDTLRGRLLAAGFAAWCSTVAASVACAGQLALSGTVAWQVALPAMGGVHMLIGLGEALITVLVIAAVARARPELLHEPDPLEGWRRSADVVGYGLLVAAGLVVFVAPFASPWPDGLQRVAASLGFAPKAAPASALAPPLAKYLVPGFGSGPASTALAGLIGAAVAFGVAYLAARALTPAHARAPASDPGDGATRG
jgi:cobalt/nickel transport system permease protein